MTLPGQIEEEKTVINLFKKSYHQFPKGKITKSESPDFILKLGPKKLIGIELTKLYNHQNVDFEYGIEQIEETIKKKEEKIVIYQRIKPHELWLIISFESHNSKYTNKLFKQIERKSFNSKFNKVIIFELFDKRIIELI